MSKALLLNMNDFTIVKEFPTMEAAYEAQDLPEYAGFAKHLVDRNDWDLTAVDLVAFYNKLTGDAVKRFADRATGMARIVKALDGDKTLLTDETVIREATRKDRTEKLKPTNTEDNMATKSKAAKKTRAPKAAIDLTKVLKPTKAGTERAWHAEANRAKLFKYIEKNGEVTIEQLIKYGKSSLEMEQGAVLACLTKLLDPKAANGASVK